MITRIHLAVTPQEYPLLSSPALVAIKDHLAGNRPVLVYFNRAGAFTVTKCDTCEKLQQCKVCDRLMRREKKEQKDILKCMNCKESHPLQCQFCKSRHITSFWERIQSIEKSLRFAFSDAKIAVISWDTKNVPTDADIYLWTQKLSHVDGISFWCVLFVLIESDFWAHLYDIEERSYIQAMHNMSKSDEVIIQTYIPEHPLVEDIANGNFRSFFRRSLSDRKEYMLPPFTEMCELRVWPHTKKSASKLATKIYTIAWTYEWGCVHVSFDESTYYMAWTEYTQKMQIEGKNLQDFLTFILPHVVGNKYLSLHWL